MYFADMLTASDADDQVVEERLALVNDVSEARRTRTTHTLLSLPLALPPSFRSLGRVSMKMTTVLFYAIPSNSPSTTRHTQRG